MNPRKQFALAASSVLFGLLSACAGSTPPADNTTTLRPESTVSTCLQDARVSGSVPNDAPSKINVRHILVRHAQARDPRGATRTRQAACERALQALQALGSGNVDWAQAVAQYSDAKDDNLGRVGPDELNAQFAAAAFALDVDELSYVVETDRGFHVIWRER